VLITAFIAFAHDRVEALTVNGCMAADGPVALSARAENIFHSPPTLAGLLSLSLGFPSMSLQGQV
jgi:hypothetical protein